MYPLTTGRIDYILKSIRIREFVKDISNLRVRALFHRLANVSRKADRIFIKNYHICTFGQGSPH